MHRLSDFVIKYLEDFEREVWEYYKRRWRRERRHPRTFFMELVFPHLKIKGLFMKVTVQKNQYALTDPANPASPLILKGKIAPTGAQGETEGVDKATITYASSNQAAATIAADPNDPDSFIVTWVGDGETTLSATAKTLDDVNTLSDSIDLTNIEPEATNLNMSLDGISAS